MIVFFYLALAISAAIGFGSGFLIHQLCRFFQWRIAQYNITVFLGAFLTFGLLYPSMSWLKESTTTTLIDMDPREGERLLSRWGLPPNTTSDFCYKHTPAHFSRCADFLMSEADFLRWMRLQKWKPVKLDSTVEPRIVFPVRASDADTQHHFITRGYSVFLEKPDRDFMRIYYDLDSARVYFDD